MHAMLSFRKSKMVSVFEFITSNSALRLCKMPLMSRF